LHRAWNKSCSIITLNADAMVKWRIVT